MYSTCIFCKKSLGTNEVVESFPIGRRLAFDPAKGRLWVVCRKCERWNLTPLEERWEAFGECEQLFRAARMRMSTDQIGIARHKEGLELVRIGEPLRPEFAAWRYGDQFGRRRRRAIVWTGVGVAAVGTVFAGAAAAGISIGAFAGLPNVIANIPVRARIKTKDGQILRLRNKHLREVRFLIDRDPGDWALSVRHEGRDVCFEGEEAVKAAGLILPKLNYMAGSRRVVQTAVDRIEAAGDPAVYLSEVVDEVRKRLRPSERGMFFDAKKESQIHRLPRPTKLALEMALHEEQERRALAGELIELELAWREAEEIASIADNLLVPPEVTEFIERHRPDTHDVFRSKH